MNVRLNIPLGHSTHQDLYDISLTPHSSTCRNCNVFQISANSQAFTSTISSSVSQFFLILHLLLKFWWPVNLSESLLHFSLNTDVDSFHVLSKKTTETTETRSLNVFLNRKMQCQTSAHSFISVQDLHPCCVSLYFSLDFALHYL